MQEVREARNQQRSRHDPQGLEARERKDHRIAEKR